MEYNTENTRCQIVNSNIINILTAICTDNADLIENTSVVRTIIDKIKKCYESDKIAFSDIIITMNDLKAINEDCDNILSEIDESPLIGYYALLYAISKSDHKIENKLLFFHMAVHKITEKQLALKLSDLIQKKKNRTTYVKKIGLLSLFAIAGILVYKKRDNIKKLWY